MSTVAVGGKGRSADGRWGRVRSGEGGCVGMCGDWANRRIPSVHPGTTAHVRDKSRSRSHHRAFSFGFSLKLGQVMDKKVTQFVPITIEK